MRVRMLVLSLLVIVLAADLAAASTEIAKPRFRTVTRTFENSGAVLAPASGGSGIANPYPSSIQVQGFRKGKVQDVNLTLHGFTHESPNDLDMVLIAPNGRYAVPMSDVGSTVNTAGLDVTLDDDAAEELSEAVPLSSGSFRPTNAGQANDPFPSMSPEVEYGFDSDDFERFFTGGNPNGEWRFFIVDDASPGSGGLAGGWSLQLTVKEKLKRSKRR